MKKIGFIDYFLDEWHAENYPAWIEEASGGEYRVCFAYAKIDGTEVGQMSSRDWTDKHNITLCDTMEEVIQKSDVLVILSPDNPEYHEELSTLALQSGKPTFIDKTFANSKEEAQRIFALAKENGTPVYSTSALRYCEEYVATRKDGISGILSVGGGSIYNYSVHQLDPVICFMGTDAKRVMFLGNDKSPSLVIEFADKRCAIINHFKDKVPFGLCINYDDGTTENISIESNFFKEFIKELVDFFETGIPKVSSEDTIAIMAIREAGLKAAKTPGEWISLDI
ncbi:MAG: Gfo/Idh/MocA family oxidoreductase [Oscillospiraceae bacterium]